MAKSLYDPLRLEQWSNQGKIAINSINSIWVSKAKVVEGNRVNKVAMVMLGFALKSALTSEISGAIVKERLAQRSLLDGCY